MREIVKEFKELLNNREYRNELSEEERNKLRENGLIVIYGASDDLMEVEGFFNNEFDCWEGGRFQIAKEGIHTEESIVQMENAKLLEAIWCSEGNSRPTWIYKTDVEHETFNIYESGELYCIGIIVDIENLK